MSADSRASQDSIDADLIRALQQDGRASIRDLAILLGVSREYVTQRLRALTEFEGVRVVAALDPGFAGHHVLVHGFIDVDGPVGPVARAVADLPNAVFVSLVSGQNPLVFESRHGGSEGLHEMLGAIRAIPAVRQVRITTYAEILRGYYVSRRRGNVSVDTLDYSIIEILQQDGRASYRELAEAVHLSPSSVRARVHKLIDAGVIRIAALKSGVISRSRLAIGFGITASGDTEPTRQYILETPEVEFAARSHGNHDFIGTVVGSSPTKVLATLEELREIPGVSAVDSWTHLDIIKEDYARAFGGAGLE